MPLNDCGRPEEQTLGIRAWLQMLRTYHKMRRQHQQLLDRHNLTGAQIDVLTSVCFSPGMTQQALAGNLLVTKGNVTGVVDRLVKRGLVERRDDPDDRRAYRLFVTDAGQALLGVALPEHHALANKMMANLTVEEQQALLSLLARIEETL